MMYRHMIDECIERQERSRDICLSFGRLDEAKHYQRAIDSYKRLRKVAPVARFGREPDEPKKWTLEEIME